MTWRNDRLSTDLDHNRIGTRSFARDPARTVRTLVAHGAGSRGRAPSAAVDGPDDATSSAVGGHLRTGEQANCDNIELNLSSTLLLYDKSERRRRQIEINICLRKYRRRRVFIDRESDENADKSDKSDEWKGTSAVFSVCIVTSMPSVRPISSFVTGVKKEIVNHQK